VSCNLQFQAFYVRNSTVYKSMLKNLFFKKSTQPDFWRPMFTAHWTWTYSFCALFFYAVLLLTVHSAQKFYSSLHAGQWLLLQLVAPLGTVFRDLATIRRKLFRDGWQVSAAHSANVRCVCTWNILPCLAFPARTVRFRSWVYPWCGALARAKEVRSGSGLEIWQA